MSKIYAPAPFHNDVNLRLHNLGPFYTSCDYRGDCLRIYLLSVSAKCLETTPVGRVSGGGGQGATKEVWW